MGFPEFQIQQAAREGSRDVGLIIIRKVRI